MMCLTIGFQNGKPTTMCLFGYTNLLIAFLVDVCIFKSPITLGQLIPTLIITFTTISLGVYQINNSTAEDQQQETITTTGKGLLQQPMKATKTANLEALEQQYNLAPKQTDDSYIRIGSVQV